MVTGRAGSVNVLRLKLERIIITKSPKSLLSYGKGGIKLENKDQFPRRRESSQKCKRLCREEVNNGKRGSAMVNPGDVIAQTVKGEGILCRDGPVFCLENRLPNAFSQRMQHNR